MDSTTGVVIHSGRGKFFIESKGELFFCSQDDIQTKNKRIVWGTSVSFKISGRAGEPFRWSEDRFSEPIEYQTKEAKEVEVITYRSDRGMELKGVVDLEREQQKDFMISFRVTLESCEKTFYVSVPKYTIRELKSFSGTKVKFKTFTNERNFLEVWGLERTDENQSWDDREGGVVPEVVLEDWRRKREGVTLEIGGIENNTLPVVKKQDWEDWRVEDLKLSLSEIVGKAIKKYQDIGGEGSGGGGVSSQETQGFNRQT